MSKLTPQQIEEVFKNSDEFLKQEKITNERFLFRENLDLWYNIAQHLVTLDCLITTHENIDDKGNYIYPLVTDIKVENLLDNSEEDILDFVRSGAKLVDGKVVIYEK